MPGAAAAPSRSVVAIRASPRAACATITSSRCGLPATTGAAARLDEIRQMRAGKRALQRPQDRRREHHVADQSQADQENLHGAAIRLAMPRTDRDPEAGSEPGS